MSFSHEKIYVHFEFFLSCRLSSVVHRSSKGSPCVFSSGPAACSDQPGPRGRRGAPGFWPGQPPGSDGSSSSVIRADCSNPARSFERLLDLTRPDWVINCAALAIVDAVKPIRYWQENWNSEFPWKTGCLCRQRAEAPPDPCLHGCGLRQQRVTRKKILPSRLRCMPRRNWKRRIRGGRGSQPGGDHRPRQPFRGA